MGEGLGPLGFGLIVVTGGFLVILAVELYYYFLHDKRFSNGHVLVRRRGCMFWSKQVERQRDQYGPVGSVRVSMASRLEDGDRDRTFEEAQEDYDSEDSDALQMHLGLGLVGPPHFLFTITEGSGEYMDSEEDAKSSRRVGSSCRASTIFMDNEEVECASTTLTTPFATPPSSPGGSDEMDHSSCGASSKILSPFLTKNNYDNNNKASFNLFHTLETSSSSFSSTSSDNPLISPSRCPPTCKTLFESASSSSSTPLTPLSNSPRMGLRSSPHLVINGKKSPISVDITTPPSPRNNCHYYYQRIPPSMQLTAASSSWRKKVKPLLRSHPSMSPPKKTNKNIIDGPILPAFDFMKEADASSAMAIANTLPRLLSDADGLYAYPKSWPPSPLTPSRSSVHSSQSFSALPA